MRPTASNKQLLIVPTENYLKIRDRKFRALEKSPGPGAPGEIGNINPPAPGTPAFKILTPDRGPRGRGIHNICIILEFYLEKKPNIKSIWPENKFKGYV